MVAITDGAQVGVRRGIIVSRTDTPEPIEIVTLPSALLRMRYTGPTAQVGLIVRNEGGPILFEFITAGTERSVAVPAGAVSIRLYTDKDKFQERNVVVVAGQETKVAFTAK